MRPNIKNNDTLIIRLRCSSFQAWKITSSELILKHENIETAVIAQIKAIPPLLQHCYEDWKNRLQGSGFEENNIEV